MSNFEAPDFPPPRRDEPLPAPLPRPVWSTFAGDQGRGPSDRSVPGASATAGESTGQRRRRSGLPAAVWIGLIGAALVILAAVAVVVSRWDTLGRSIRGVLVTAAAAATLVAASRLRSITPTTADLIAHLGAVLVTAAGIAVGSMAGFTWPSCLVIGGIAGFAASDLLSRRWSPSWFAIGEVVNAALIAAGLAALTHSTAGALASLMAIGFVAARRNVQAVALVTAALLSPVSAGLASLGVGAGTLRRAGLIGERLAWSGPVVGVVAAAIAIIVARRLGKPSLSSLGLLAPVIGIATSFAVTDAPRSAWWALPGVALILLEVGHELLPERSAARTAVVDIAAGGIAAGAVLISARWSASMILSSRFASVTAERPGSDAILALAVTIVGLVVAVRRWRSTVEPASEFGIAVIAGLAADLLIAIGSAPMIVALASVALLAVAIGVSRTRGAIVVDLTALGALAMFAAYAPMAARVELAGYRVLTVLVIASVVVVRTRYAPRSSTMASLELIGIYAVAGLQVAAMWSNNSPAATALIVVSGASVLATLIARRAFLAQAIATGGLGALTALWTLHGYAVHLRADRLVWVSMVAVAASFAIVWWRYRFSRALDLSVAAVVAAIAAAGTQVGLAPTELLAMMLTIAIAMSGVTAVVGQRSPFDFAGPGATILAFACAGPGVTSMAISCIVIALGIQIAILGYRYANDVVIGLGTGLNIIGIVSLWWTTPWNAWLNRVLAPVAATTADVAALTATSLLIALGYQARRRRRLSTWVAYSPGLVVGGLWLTAVSSDRVTFWAAPLGLALGIGAVAVGAWRRLAAPLVLGTVIVGAIVVTSYATYFGDVPMWVWLALGGTGLIAIAVIIERRSGEGSSLADLITRWE